MTIGTSLSEVTVEGNGVTTAFTYPFLMPDASDAVIAYLATATTAPVYLSPTQYNISGIGNPAGGVVTYPLSGPPIALGSFLVIQRILPLVQTTTVSNQGPTFAAIEGALDTLEMQIQQLETQIITPLQPVLPSGPVQIITNIATLRANVTAAVAVVYVEGYNTSQDGGEGLFELISTDRSSADNGGTIIVDAGGNRWYRDTQGNRNNVKWFGARGNGAADDTAAIQSAINVAPGNIWLPVGNYLVSSTITITATNDPYVVGQSEFGTIITFSGTGHLFDVVNVSSSRCHFSNISLNTTTPSTLSAGINSAISELFVDHVSFLYWGVGIQSADNIANITNCEMSYLLPVYGVGIRINAAPGASLIDNVLMRPSGIAAPFAGIEINNDSCLISNCNIIGQGYDLLLSPGDGQVVSSIFAINTYFDAATEGIHINPQGTGAVVRCLFTGCWTSSHTGNGVTIAVASAGNVAGVHFMNHIAINNGGSGIVTEDNAVISDIAIEGGLFANNAASGIYIGENMGEFTITGISAGSYGGVPGNGTYGIIVGSGTSSHYIVTLNRVTGNGTGGVLDGGGASYKYVANNIG